MTSGESHPAGSRFRWQVLVVPLLGMAAIAAGIAALQAPRRSAGWFAYAPLADQSFFSGDFILMDDLARAGYLLVGAGLLTLAFWLGFRLGRRRAGHHGPRM